MLDRIAKLAPVAAFTMVVQAGADVLHDLWVWRQSYHQAEKDMEAEGYKLAAIQPSDKGSRKRWRASYQTPDGGLIDSETYREIVGELADKLGGPKMRIFGETLRDQASEAMIKEGYNYTISWQYGRQESRFYNPAGKPIMWMTYALNLYKKIREIRSATPTPTPSLA